MSSTAAFPSSHSIPTTSNVQCSRTGSTNVSGYVLSYVVHCFEDGAQIQGLREGMILFYHPYIIHPMLLYKWLLSVWSWVIACAIRRRWWCYGCGRLSFHSARWFSVAWTRLNIHCFWELIIRMRVGESQRPSGDDRTSLPSELMIEGEERFL